MVFAPLQGFFDISGGLWLGLGPPTNKLTSAPSSPCARDISACYKMWLDSNLLLQLL